MGSCPSSILLSHLNPPSCIYHEPGQHSLLLYPPCWLHCYYYVHQYFCLLILHFTVANYFYSRPPMALQSNLYTVKENLTAIIVGEEQVL